MRWRAEECSSSSARAPAVPPVAGGCLPCQCGLEEAGACLGEGVAEEEAEPSYPQGGAAVAGAAWREVGLRIPAAVEDTRGHLVSPVPAGGRRAPRRPVSGGGGGGRGGVYVTHVNLFECFLH